MSAEAIQLGSFILATITTIVVCTGIPLALLNLRKISHTHHLQALNSFYSDLASSEEERRYLFREFDRTKPIDKLVREDEKTIEIVINTLNRIGLLVEQKILAPELVFSICHTVIIRCWHQLEPYVTARELRDGARYARRVRRLDERAKKFHDSRPHQRVTEIRINNGKTQVLVYKTAKIQNHLCSFEWLERSIRYYLRIY